MYGSVVGGTGQVRVTRDGDINRAMGLTNRKQTEINNNNNSNNSNINGQQYNNPNNNNNTLNKK